MPRNSDESFTQQTVYQEQFIQIVALKMLINLKNLSRENESIIFITKVEGRRNTRHSVDAVNVHSSEIVRQAGVTV